MFTLERPPAKLSPINPIFSVMPVNLILFIKRFMLITHPSFIPLTGFGWWSRQEPRGWFFQNEYNTFIIALKQQSFQYFSKKGGKLI